MAAWISPRLYKLETWSLPQHLPHCRRQSIPGCNLPSLLPSGSSSASSPFFYPKSSLHDTLNNVHKVQTWSWHTILLCVLTNEGILLKARTGMASKTWFSSSLMLCPDLTTQGKYSLTSLFTVHSIFSLIYQFMTQVSSLDSDSLLSPVSSSAVLRIQSIPRP